MHVRSRADPGVLPQTLGGGGGGGAMCGPLFKIFSLFMSTMICDFPYVPERVPSSNKIYAVED